MQVKNDILFYMKPQTKLIIVVIVVIFSIIAYWLVSPFWIDTRVDEAVPISVQTEEVSSIEILSSGTFTGFDKIHYGSGTATLISDGTLRYIRFESDFDVANGPDLYVGFGKDGEYVKGSEIGKLKGNQGSQNYLIPTGIDISEYNEVWVWCKAFSVPFARAILQ